MSMSNNDVGATGARQKYFKLQDFWPSSPHTWFGIVEAQFQLWEVTSEADRFTLVASVLPESSACCVLHLLTTPPADCYIQLKASLLSSHQLTEIQKAELLFNMDDLGSKRPMDLLTEMVVLVKPGEEKTQLFAMLFMRRLPPPVCVQLTEDDHTDLRALAEKAERYAAMLVRNAGATTVNAILPTEEEGRDHTVLV